jgi:hypothetical protein
VSDIENDQRAFARERLTVSSSPVSLTRALYENDSDIGTTKHMKAKAAKLFVEGTVNIYLAENGVTPSGSVGITLVPGQYHLVRGQESLRNLRMVRVTTDAEVEVVYYR